MDDDARWHTYALRLVLGVTIVRLLWHLITPIGILGDEAYYWEWGRHLDWGYFSKPPLIGWIYGMVGHLTAHSLYAFKATATLFTGGAIWFLYLAVRRLLGARIAFWTAAASALSVGNLMLAAILTIDAPLIFFWTFALYFAVRVLFSEGSPAWRDTLLLTVALGLGHLSKQMMLTFPPLLLTAAFLFRRDLLTNAQLYVATLGSLLFLLPPLIWNSKHQWITFAHTGHHFETESINPLEILVRYLELGGVSALLLTPIFFILLIGAHLQMRRWSSQPREAQLLFLFGGVALIAITAMVFRQEINPNWPAAFYPAAIALTTWWCLNGDSDTRRRWFQHSLKLGAVLSLAAMSLLPLMDALGLPAQRRGWRGYPQFSSAIAGTLRGLPADKLKSVDNRILISGHRFTCSQLAFHLRHPTGDQSPPNLYLWPKPNVVASQYDFWESLPIGSSALLVMERRKETSLEFPPAPLKDAFERIEEVSEIPLHPNQEYPKFRVFIAYSLKHWPSPLSASSP